VHLPVAVHRHPRAGHHPDHPEPERLSTDQAPTRAARPLVARNVTRGTELAADLEVASSLWGKFKGLMGRPSLAPGAGLWLPESNGIHMMFMRFPIDAVFVGRPDPDHAEARAVISVHRALRAWTGLVPLVRGAHGVLELPVGTIDATGTLVGDHIALEAPGSG
jgi:uncharacterized protein